MADGVRIERDGVIKILRFDRPEKKNAINGAMYEVLAEALEDANRASDIGVCVFLGAPGAFTAGNDIADFVAMASEGALGAPVLRFLRALSTSERPLLAGVDGLAVGIGATLLLHCDYVLATRRTILRTPFTALGLVPEAGSSLLAPRLMGHARAFELLVMGLDLDSEGARSAGLVNGIVASEELEGAIVAAAHDLAAKPREAVLASRRLLKGEPADVLAQIAVEAEAFAERIRSPEAQRAFAAFIQKGKR